MPDVRILQNPDLEFSDIAKLTEFHIIVLKHGLAGDKATWSRPAAVCDGTVNVAPNKFISRLFEMMMKWKYSTTEVWSSGKGKGKG